MRTTRPTPEEEWNWLALDYSSMFEDEDARIDRAREWLGPLIESKYAEGGTLRILDPTCGPGTHVIALAQRRHHLVGSDISEKMIEQTRRHLAERDLEAELKVADIRNLALFCDHGFDAAICLGNSIASLSTESDLTLAFAQVRMTLRQKSPFVVGLRDYGPVLAGAYEGKAMLNGPHAFTVNNTLCVVHQLWRWHNSYLYDCDVHLHRIALDGTSSCCAHHLSRCRAWQLDEVKVALKAVGFRLDDSTNVATAQGSVYQHGFDQLIIVATA